MILIVFHLILGSAENKNIIYWLHKEIHVVWCWDYWCQTVFHSLNGIVCGSCPRHKIRKHATYIRYLLHPIVEFYNAVFGTIALIGNDILVRLKSPVIIFLPINFTISLPIDLIFFTWDLSSQNFPPSEYASWCRG